MHELSTPSTFDALYDAHYDRAWRVARRMGVPEWATDDVLQDVFLVVFRRLGSLTPSANERAWVTGITLNVVRAHRRSFRRHGAHAELPDTLAADGPTPLDALQRREAVAMLDRVLDTLDDDRREVLVLTEYGQHSAPEIAIILNIPVNTVYTRLRLAREDFESGRARLSRSER